MGASTRVVRATTSNEAVMQMYGDPQARLPRHRAITVASIFTVSTTGPPRRALAGMRQSCRTLGPLCRP